VPLLGPAQQVGPQQLDVLTAAGPAPGRSRRAADRRAVVVEDPEIREQRHLPAGGA
jgi:hypothetical protein